MWFRDTFLQAEVGEWVGGMMQQWTLIRLTVVAFQSSYRRINLTAVPGRQVLKAACMSIRTPGFELYAVVVILVSYIRSRRDL